MVKKEELDFEIALKRLEEIVTELESGELSLAESLKKYEAGVKLTRLCSAKLEAAEDKIEIIKKESGQLKVEDYDYQKGAE